MKLICCSIDSVWIENVPGKGYFFCQECRKEVVEKIKLEYVDDMDEHLSYFILHNASTFSEMCKQMWPEPKQLEYIPQDQIDTACDDLYITLKCFEMFKEDIVMFLTVYCEDLI